VQFPVHVLVLPECVSVRLALSKKQVTTYLFTKRWYNEQLVDYIGQNACVTTESL
jgi:hypothetical protein